MRYTYAYKTRDGTRHEAALEAPSREAAFEALRARGVRPIKVVAADGSKANGEPRALRGGRAAVFAASLAVLSALATCAVFFLGGGARLLRAAGGAEAVPPFLASETRRQVIGDPAIIQRGVRTGWRDVFAHEGERFLASFAVPGEKAGVRRAAEGAVAEALGRSLPPGPGDALEARQVKAMVEGMKREARAYLAAGGTLAAYGRRLAERQDAEAAVRRRAEAEVLAARRTLGEDDFLALCERRNDELRALGLRPITLPE